MFTLEEAVPPRCHSFRNLQRCSELVRHEGVEPLTYQYRHGQQTIKRLILRLPQLEQGFSLDLDSTIFSRHGIRQQGATKGYTPRRPGRLSHHPLLAVLAEANFIRCVLFFAAIDAV